MSQTIALALQKLGTKLVLMATVFLLVGLVAIGLTLLVSWDLEGGAAAVNQAGAERMRAYRIALLLSQAELPGADRAAIRAEVDAEIAAFDRTMKELKVGDPGRPMFLPRAPEIRRHFDGLQRLWDGEMKPAIAGLASVDAGPSRIARVLEYRATTDSYVHAVHRLVDAIEQEISRKTSQLRTLQLGLVWLSIAGTVALIYLMFLMVIRPVTRIEEGMQRMEAGDFDARVPIETRDEFGSLAAGFNRMAAHLQDLYRNLEARVERKTQSLARQNRDLSALYELTALMNRPGTLEELGRGFLRKLMSVLGADGGAVRLTDEKSGRVHLFINEKLTPAFAAEEACLAPGECLCGDAAHSGEAVVRLFPQGEGLAAGYGCQRAGYATVSAFAIESKNQVLGVFNLFFRQVREFDADERLMLDALGKHLGVAIENQRLVERERELAVSEERNLLAQELHDSIAQSLAFLNLQAQMVDEALGRNDNGEAREGMAQIREGIQESYDDVRELLVHFRTRFGQSDVETALRTLLDRFASDTGIETDFRQAGSGLPLPPETQIHALHIVQECLSNVRKHAGAGKVTVELQRGPAYRFRVSDDGRGFATGVSRDGHVGLAIMRERAQRIGGSIDIDSQPGAGTRITLTVPVAIQEEVAA
jgi:two-component system, NarL family, nitrate/nitrite sensor histidine kinase NarX